MATPLPEWVAAAADEVTDILRAGMDDAVRRDCVTFSPAAWLLLSVLEKARAEYLAAQRPTLRLIGGEGGTDTYSEGGTASTLVSVTEAADILGISRKGVRMRIKRGQLAATWTDAGYRIVRDDLERAA